VILLRQRLMDDLAAIEKGDDPKGLIRDAAVNHRVPLPIAERRYLTESISREELVSHPVLGKQYLGEYPFQAGQPEEVRRAYAEAMGIG
jgi:5,5'-dehydrodivanillate O-demethylase oxygenase subunit